MAAETLSSAISFEEFVRLDASLKAGLIPEGVSAVVSQPPVESGATPAAYLIDKAGERIDHGY